MHSHHAGLVELDLQSHGQAGSSDKHLDPLRAQLHARIKATALLHLSRQWDSTGARMQKGKYNQPCHDLGMPELRNVLYGPLNQRPFC